MRLKSAYKNIPSEPPPPASEKVSVEVPDKAGPETTVAIEPPPADEATVALMRQLDSLRKSEELQKQYAIHQRAVQAQQQPRTRVEFLQSQGLTKAEAEFFDGNEQMMTHQQEASDAAAEALAAGCERDSPQFFEHVERGFAERLDALNQRTAEQPAPAFFQPTEPPPRPAAPDRSSLYAAPVSRRDAGSREPVNPRQIKLTPEEQQIAAASGISDVEYAANKLKMLRERASGQRE